MDKEITRENGRAKAKVKCDKYGSGLLTTLDGWQWTGVHITPESAKLIIEVLREYLGESNA